MTSSRKHPSAAFWATVVVVVLVGFLALLVFTVWKPHESAGSVQKFDAAGHIRREFAESAALDEVVAQTHAGRDRLTADLDRVEKYWHQPESADQPILLSGWRVWVWRHPPMPGGHYTLFVADDGDVIDFGRGK